MLRLTAFLLLVFVTQIGYANIFANKIELGEHRPGQRVAFELIFKNDSDYSDAILRTNPESPFKFDLTKLPLEIPPNGIATTQASVLVGQDLGKQDYFIDMEVRGAQKKLMVSVSLFVDSAIEGEPLKSQFGVVAAGKSISQTIELRSLDLPNIHAISVVDALKNVVAEVSDDGKKVTVKTRLDSTWGIHDGWLEIVTDSPEQPRVWVKYRFETRGKIVPDVYEIGAGLQRVGNTTPFNVFVRDIDGAAVQLGKITHEGADVDIGNIDCPVPSLSCRQIKIHLSNKLKAGKFSGDLHIDLPKFRQNLTIAYSGFLISADTKIKDMTGGTLEPSSQFHEANIGSALKAAVAEEPNTIAMPIPEGLGPLLRWDIQNEKLLYGYNVYRSDSEDGALHRINTSTIQTLSKEDGIPVEYRWRDTTAVPGHTYWYQIGTVDQRDVRKDLTGRVKKTYTVDSATAK